MQKSETKVGAAQVVVAPASADNRAHVDAGKAGEVGAGFVGEVHVADGGDGLAHVGDGVDGLLLAADVAGVSEYVDGHFQDAGVDGDHVFGAEGFGDDGHVGEGAVLDEVGGADTALKLADDAGEDKVAFQFRAGESYGLSGGNHGGDAGLHVADASAKDAVSFNGRSPGVAFPAHGEGVHVDMAVEH